MAAKDQNVEREKEIDKDTLKRIHRYEQRFRKSSDAYGSHRKILTELDEFDRGDQWKNTSAPPWIPKPVTNFVRFIRTLKRANLASAIPKANFRAESEGDEDVVQQLQKAYDHVWEGKHIARTVRRIIDRTLLQGTGIAYIHTDSSKVGGKYYGEGNTKNQLFQGEICVERFPIANFFPDPDAYRLEQCKWIDTTEILSLEFVKNHPAFTKWCEEKGTLKKLKALETDQLEREADANGEIYIRDVQVGDGVGGITGDEMVTLHTHWERHYVNGKWKLNVTYYLRNTDFTLLELEDVQPNEYPFAILYDEEEENSFFGTSTIMDVIENQKIVNKVQQAAAILGVLHQNPQKVVSRESGINAQELARTGTLPGKVWVSNLPADQSISVVQPMDIPKGLFDLDDRTQNNIRDMVGVNEAYTGQSVGSLTTSTGVDSLIERATIRDKDKMIQIDEFVERISNLVVLNILHNWKDERPIARKGLKGFQEFETFKPVDKLDAENLSWRVESNVYAKAPMTQATRRQQADKLMQMQGQFMFDPPLITPEEWIKFQEFDNEQDILSRMEEDRNRLDREKESDMAQQIVDAAGQIKELMAQGMPPEEAMAQASQMVQEMLTKQKAEESKNGLGSPASESQAPQGVTSQVAMSNMANGS